MLWSGYLTTNCSESLSLEATSCQGTLHPGLWWASKTEQDVAESNDNYKKKKGNNKVGLDRRPFAPPHPPTPTLWCYWLLSNYIVPVFMCSGADGWLSKRKPLITSSYSICRRIQEMNLQRRTFEGGEEASSILSQFQRVTQLLRDLSSIMKRLQFSQIHFGSCN